MCYVEFGKQLQYSNSSLYEAHCEDGIDVTDADLEYTFVNGTRVQFHREK